MDSFSIKLEGVAGPYKVLVTPFEESGIMRFRISSSFSPGGDMVPWTADLEPDCGGWKQTETSTNVGPALPCFFVEEIGETVEQHLKDI